MSVLDNENAAKGGESFMNKYGIRMLLLCCLFVLLFGTSAFAFQDTKGDPAEAKIEALQKAGIVNGVSDEKFDPKGNVTWAQGVHLIVKGLNLNMDAIRFIKEPKASDYFTDVPDDAWYAKSLITAYHNGLTLPKDLHPGQALTKEQFASLLAAGVHAKADFSQIEIFIQIADGNEINPDYMNAIQTLLIAKIASLDAQQMFHPKSELTRSEAAEMIYNAVEFVKQHAGNGSGSTPSQPPIDQKVTLSTEKVNENVNKVTLSWGSKPNAGYRITIDGIEFKANGEAIIRYSLHLPEPGHMYAQVVTEPKAETYVASKYKVIAKLSESGSAEMSAK
jgi:hypothetical protein